MRKLPKKVFVIMGVIALLGVATYVCWPLIQHAFEQKAPDIVITTKTGISTATQAALSVARDQVASGDNAGAIKNLDAAIATSDSDADKGKLYAEKSMIQANTGDTKSAAETSAQASMLDPSLGHFDYTAQLYERQGDNQNAIIYYQKALDAYDKEVHKDGGAQISRDYYVNKINTLGGQAS